MQNLLFFLLFLFIGTASTAQQIDESLLVASLERTTCYGNCPYYEVKFYANGFATYHGKKNVEFMGQYQATIPKELLTKLLQKADLIGYHDLGNKYPVKGLGIIDFPVCITSLKTEQGQKIIYNRNDAPQRLVDYQKFFDELVEEIDWQKK
ncbi:DUF6438 domain-containing protein [Aureispira anguillae]|uniref:DUF6438 domain-containing protein n=1 Tax=Aureispira anguillae TaxID=2864201 RepID=A0A915VJT9_9BACT|nr:DUF6438 domain-containing protein [Aureispira anguillae]BDS09333.1 DUF6438 domain-containing protein [Aureispira anguillae]